MVGQGLGRSHHNGIPCVYTHRVEIFHVADGDAVVIAIPHNFVFDFLPAGHAALNEHLADHGIVQSLDNYFYKLFFILGNTASGAAHGVGRAHNDGVADFTGKVHCAGYIFDNGALRDGLTQGLHGLLELLPVLCLLNGLQGCPQKLHPVLIQHALFCKLHSQIQPCLTSQCS